MLFIGSALALTLTHAQAAIPEEATSFANYLTALQQKEEQIWPGMTVAKQPIIFLQYSADPSPNSLYAFNFKAQNPNWQPITIGSQTAYTMADTIGVNDFEPTLQQPTDTVDGQQVLITREGWSASDLYNNMQYGQEYYAYYELNESSNRASKLQLATELNRNAYTGINNVETIATLMLESKALNDYLQHHNEEALKDYVAVWRTHTDSLDSNSKLYEVTAGEPLSPAYFGLMSAAHNQNEVLEYLDNHVPILVNEDVGVHYFPDDGIEMHNDFSEFIIEAIGVSLDNLNINWKNSVDANNTPQSEILAQHYPMNSSEIQKRVQDAKMHYGYNKDMQDLHAMFDNWLNKMKTAVNLYQNNTGIEINLVNANTGYFTQVDDYCAVDTDHEFPCNAFDVDTLNRLHTQVTELNTDNKSIDIKGIDLIWHTVTRSDNYQVVTRFKMSGDAIITVDGTKQTLAAFIAKAATETFGLLEISKDNQLLTINSHDSNLATVSVDHGKLVIK